MKLIDKNIALLIVGTVFLATFWNVSVSVKAETANDVLGYAWSDNIGWIEFQPSLGGVSLDQSTGILSGYAWSENIGWIYFGPSDNSAAGLVIANAPAEPKQWVKMDVGSGAVSGWAKAVAGDSVGAGGWDGWISMSGATGDGDSYGVEMSTASGDFSGWAWGGDVVGWLVFNTNSSPLGGSGDGGQIIVTITPENLPDTLGIEFSADPVNGSLSNGSFSSTLSVKVKDGADGGTAGGSVMYKFDCNDDGVYEETKNIPDYQASDWQTYACNYTSEGSYVASVRAERGTAVAIETQNINVGATPTINLSLSLDATSITLPDYEVDLTLNVSGGSGLINYIFDCDGNSVSPYTASSISYDSLYNDMRYDGVGSETMTHSCKYLSAGTYHPLVFAIRNGVFVGPATVGVNLPEITVNEGSPSPYFNLWSAVTGIKAVIVEDVDTGAVNATPEITLNLLGYNGFSGAVNLTASGGPSGTTYAFGNSSPSLTGSEAITTSFNVFVPVNAASGNYTITVTGTGGGITSSQNIILKVTRISSSEAEEF